MEKELWRQCVRWLTDTGVLPRDHKTCQPHAVVFDLAQTLRDGVILCNLLNVIQPGSVDFTQINLRPQMLQFSCLQNIRTTVHALNNVFRLQETFLPSDLYDMTNIPLVLQVLSLLSQTPASQYKFRPFPESHVGRKQTYNHEEEEDIYSNLADMASQRDLADEEENLYDSVPEDVDEGIYGSLIAVKQATGTLKDKRGYCITEIIETERNYVQHLTMMIGKFIEPFRQHQGIDEKDIRAIFMNIEDLLPIHQDFLRELEKSSSESPSTLSRPFLKFKDRFLLYGLYCSKLIDAQDHLEDVKKMNPRSGMFVEECEARASPSKFKLRELLCVPMQRILKYQLLVKELNKHTIDKHPDKGELAGALESMQELSHYVNEVKRDSEMLITINQVQSCLVEYSTQIPLNSYGRLQKDGELRIKSTMDKKAKSRNTFLFDQALFMTKEENGNYHLKDLLRLEEYKLEEIQQTKGGKWTWNWCLSATKNGCNSYMLYAKTAMDKTKWIEKLKDSFDNISPRELKNKSHNFKMHSFSEPTYCNNCNKLLLGTFYQGYWCQNTNAKCHKHCLGEILKKLDSKAVRASRLYPPNAGSSGPEVPQRGKRARPIDKKPMEAPSIPPSIPAQLSKAAAVPPPTMYRAHRDYNGNPRPPFPGVMTISFSSHEYVMVDEEVSSDWWLGHTTTDLDRKGYFPASFVSPVTTKSARPERSNNYIQSVPGEFPRRSNHPPVTPPQQDIPLEENIWYAGTMDRGGAENLLHDKPSGTFLVRIRDGHLAISLIYSKEMKHIRINRSSEGLYFVAECKNFKSVQELIRYYRENSMSSSFLGLETSLQIPYRDPNFFPGMPGPSARNFPPQPQVPRQGHRPSIPGPQQIVAANGTQYDVISRAVVLFNFSPRSPQELGLREGQPVNVISTAGDAHGWWKGESEGQVGYFPATFVEEIRQ
ncbi:guanine nucleotide exchange factor VAV2-like isoform X2 [Ciona intestinalis]